MSILFQAKLSCLMFKEEYNVQLISTITDTYLETWQTSKMEHFMKIVNG